LASSVSGTFSIVLDGDADANEIFVKNKIFTAWFLNHQRFNYTSGKLPLLGKLPLGKFTTTRTINQEKTQE